MGVNDTQVKKLYLRLPCKIQEESQIKDLHPDITTVILPRQKSARWCHVEFESHTKCLEAFKVLKKHKIQGKSLRVGLAKPRDETADDHPKKKAKKPKKSKTETSNPE